jgi:uncharacterized protein YfbU (UPF0304 family)
MLRTKEASSVTLSKIERLLLFNQYRILEVLVPEVKDTYRMYQEILEHGFEGEYHELFNSVYLEPLSAEDSREVTEVLRMFQALKRSGAGDTAPPTEGNVVSIGKGDESEVRFSGYDLNDESEAPKAAFARYLQRDRGSFLDVIDRERINSHYPMAEQYREMLERWKELGMPATMNRGEVRKVVGRWRSPPPSE